MNLLYALSLALVGYWTASLYSSHSRRTRERRHRLEQRRKAGIPDSDSRPFDVAREDALRRREEVRVGRREEVGGQTSVVTSSPFSRRTPIRQPSASTSAPSLLTPLQLAPSPNPYIPAASLAPAAPPLPLSRSNLVQLPGSAKRGVPSTFSDAALPSKIKREAPDGVRTIIRDIPPVHRKRRQTESIADDEQVTKRGRRDSDSDDASDAQSDSEMLQVEEDATMDDADDDDAADASSLSDRSMDVVEAYPHGLKRTLASAAIAEEPSTVDPAKKRRSDVANRLRTTRPRTSTPSSPPPSKRAFTPSSPYRASTLASKHVPSSTKTKRTVDTSDDHEIGSEWTDLNGLTWRMGEDGVARREVEYFERLPRFDMPKDSLHPDRHELEWKKVRGWVDEERFEELKREKRLGWQEAEREELEKAAATVTPVRQTKPRRSVDPGALFNVPQGPPLRFSPAIAASSPGGGSRLAPVSTSSPSRSRLGTPRSAMLDQTQKARREEAIMRALRDAKATSVAKTEPAGEAAKAKPSETKPASTSFSFGASKPVEATRPTAPNDAASTKPSEKPAAAPTFSFGAPASSAGPPSTSTFAPSSTSKPSAPVFTFGAK